MCVPCISTISYTNLGGFLTKKEIIMPKLKPTAPKKAKKKRVKEEMHKFKEGKLHSGSKKGPVVENPKQAIAIALSESGQSKKKKKKHKKNK
jgi:hypothetical protein